jgi:benzoyl-CoA reductase/2-hydroxyglutaryl-CoA dehydratase subunit BcrC/BadD/HgdB
MNELLKLCGFETQEIEVELLRIQRAFDRLGITTEDIERGKQRLTKYYDVELEGIRKALRLCVREVIDSVLAREEGKKGIFYGFMAPGFETIGSALVSISKEVFSAHHSWALQIVVGCIFGNIIPILEAAEKKWLKAGVVAHCANVKTLLGPIALDLFPKPDLMVTAGFLCETSSKTIDLLHELYDIPIYCYDTCIDREFKEYSEATKRVVALAAKSLRRLVTRIQEIAGFGITDDMLWEAINTRRKLGDAVHKLKDLVASSDPLVLSPTHDNIWMCLNSLTLNMDGLSEAIDAVNTLYEELQERVEKKVGVVEKGAPRIMAILPAGQTDPRLEHLACDVGLAIVASDLDFSVPYGETPKDPYMEIVIALQNSLNTSLPRRIPLLIEGCKSFNVDGVLNRYHMGCRSVAGDALVIQNAVKKELGIPVLLLEWENFDPRVYDHEEYRRRLEVFKAMMTKKSA